MASSISQRYLRAAILVIGITVFLTSLLFPEWMRHAIKRDRATAVPREGTAVVALTVPARPGEMGDPMPAQVTVRFDGRLLSPTRIVGFDRIHVGDTVHIVYRAGKSGRIYLDEVEPLR